MRYLGYTWGEGGCFACEGGGGESETIEGSEREEGVRGRQDADVLEGREAISPREEGRGR